MTGRRIPSAIAAIAVLAAFLAVGVALAAKPKSPAVKGGSYSGTLAAPRTYITVAFKVSKNGKVVSGLKTDNLPIYCPGGGPVPIKFKNATIGKAGTFTSTGTQIYSSGPSKGKKGATLTIIGHFLAGRKESGKITTTFPASFGTSCNGSSKYSTHA